MGGIVEEMMSGAEVRSPSVQMRLTPTGELEIVSTHDQILGGKTGGEFIAPDGRRKYYRATDSLTSKAYRGLLPEDLMDILDTHGLGFSADQRTGVLFHMMGALSEHGKVGITTIGNSAEEAESFFRRTVEVLDLETRVAPAAVDARPIIPKHTPARLLPME